VTQEPSAPEPTPASEPAPPPAPAPAQPLASAPAQAMAGAPAQPMVSPRMAPRSRSGRILNAVLGIAVALAIGGVAFAAGRLTAPTPVTAFGNGGPGQFFGNGNGNGNGGNRGNGQGGAGSFLAGGGITLQGTVESIDATTLTLKTASGQTIQIALDGTTTYHAQSDASASDVTTGKTVLVRVNGFRGARPGASFTPTNGGATSQTATDVTVVP
jgi:hypothetical protein